MAALLAAALGLALAAAVPPSLKGRELERLPTVRKEVVLTIDAGANAAGAWPMLRVLRRHDVPATFFLTGKWVERYPGVARAIGRAHPVGNHTYSHPHFTRLGDPAIATEIGRGERVIRRATRRDPRPFLRFPYGDRDRRTIAAANRAGYVSIRWSVDTHGWMGRSRQSRAGVVRRVLDRLEPGAIVMMHLGSAADGSTLDADALPVVIAAVRARGYTFTTLERLRRRARG